MEYISAEEFLKQPKEVQATFLNWWKPSIGDLFNFPEIDNQDCREVECICSTNRLKTISLTRIIPLLTEGQLRKFIEDKTEKILEILTDQEECQYMISLVESFENDEGILFDKLGIDLLQAYWKVAIEIAKEELKND